MPFVIACPFCSARIEVPDELNDTAASCPSCGQDVYLSRDDAVEDLDPALDAVRRENAAAERQHRQELQQVMMMQDQARQSRENTKKLVNVLLWIFVWGPLCAAVLLVLVWALLRFAHG